METSSPALESNATDVVPKDRHNGVELSPLPAIMAKARSTDALAPSSAEDTAHSAGPIADFTTPPSSSAENIPPPKITKNAAPPDSEDPATPPSLIADTLSPLGSTSNTATLPADNALTPKREVGAAGPGASPALSGSKQSLGAHADAAIAAMEATVATETTNGTEVAASDSGSAVHPLLVFINSNSGGRVGPSLLAGFQKLLGKSQVRMNRATHSEAGTSMGNALKLGFKTGFRNLREVTGDMY